MDDSQKVSEIPITLETNIVTSTETKNKEENETDTLHSKKGIIVLTYLCLISLILILYNSKKSN